MPYENLDATIKQMAQQAAAPPTAGSFMDSVNNTEDAVTTIDGIVDTINSTTAPLGMAETMGTFNKADNLNEQTVAEMVITKRTIIHALWIDLVNLIKSTIIRVYVKVDGVNYREISSQTWTTAMADGVDAASFWANSTTYHSYLNAVNTTFKVTVQTTGGVAEGAARDIPYNFITEAREL